LSKHSGIKDPRFKSQCKHIKIYLKKKYPPHVYCTPLKKTCMEVIRQDIEAKGKAYCSIGMSGES